MLLPQAGALATLSTRSSTETKLNRSRQDSVPLNLAKLGPFPRIRQRATPEKDDYRGLTGLLFRSGSD